MTPGFTATQRIDDGVLVVVVEGELDLATAPELDEVVGDPFAEGTGTVRGSVVDLEGCSFLDSSGARTVATLGERLGRSGLPVAVASPPGSAARQVLDLMGIAHRVPLKASRADAREAVLDVGGASSS